MASEETDERGARRPRRWPWVVGALALVVGLGLAGIAYHRAAVGEIRRAKHDELEAIAALKAAEVERWRGRTRRHAARLGRDPTLCRFLAEWKAGPASPETASAVRDRIGLTLDDERYAGCLVVDLEGRVLLGSPDGVAVEQLGPMTRHAFGRAVEEVDTVLSEPHRGPDGLVYVDAVAPIVAEDGNLIGAAVLRVDAGAELYPRVRSWPSASQSAEALLVRPEGDRALILSEARHRSDGALALPVLVSRGASVAGMPGVASGVDYRNAEVLWSSRPIAESSWFLVAKEDAAEALAAVEYRSSLLLGITGLLALLAVAGVGLTYLRQQARYDRLQLVAAREKLRVERELRVTLYSVGDGVIATDTEGNIRVANRVAEQLCGWTEDEARGRPLGEVFRLAGEEHGAVDDAAKRVLSGEPLVAPDDQAVLTARDGTERPIAAGGAPVADDSGALFGTVLVFRDQTEERRVQRHLRNLNSMLAAVRNVNQLIVRERDVPRLLEQTCAELTRISGFERAWVFLLDPDGEVATARSAGFPEEATDPALSWGAGGGPACLEVARTNVTTTGDSLGELCACCRFADRHGDPVRMVTPVALDGEVRGIMGVAGSAQAEVGPVELSLLEELAGDLAYALHGIDTEKERRDMRVELAKSERLASMGMLAAGVAHEINNPLTYILYNLESLARELPRLSEQLRGRATAAGVDPQRLDAATERVRDALVGVTRIRDLTRSLGTFSRVDVDEVRPVDVGVAASDALTMASNSIKYRARLDVDLTEVPPVLASDGKLAQVFLNLLINAAHAIEVGRVEDNRISIRSYQDGGQVCVEVGDTGSGIPTEIQARIFDPFFTTKPAGVGSGLGLAICRDIITGFGGDIEVASEPGRGTRFVVRLPRAPDDWAEPESAAPAPRPAPTACARILVVDDEPAVREAVVGMLGQEHDALAAASGTEARELLARDRAFDLILCDLMMPEMSGMELHAWLLAEYPALAERVVFITGGAFSPGALDYLASVDNPRFEKPLDPEQLRRLVAERCGG